MPESAGGMGQAGLWWAQWIGLRRGAYPEETLNSESHHGRDVS